MNKSKRLRFNPAGLAIGAGVGAALCASSGPATGISIGIAVAIAFSLRRSAKLLPSNPCRITLNSFG